MSGDDPLAKVPWPLPTLLRVRRVDVFQKLVQFRRTRARSVTTDWVVLTVATVLLGVIVFVPLLAEL